jgi:RNA polymerase sigma-70 factor (ECF subfamily)
MKPVVDDAFHPAGINDVQLRMMFSCIHPQLPEETQLALVLHLLCGFGIDETAAVFLKKRDALERRLSRAKRALAESTELFELKGASDVASRLPAVLHALAALMDFLAARLPSRVDSEGNLLLLVDQDRSLWDADLIAEARRQLELSASGDQLTAYHIEAAIAERHAAAKSLDDTDWDGVISLYTTLMRIKPSPVVALNRAVAIAQSEGPARGLLEIEAIPDRQRLRKYPFFFTATGEFQLRLGHRVVARKAFETALGLARNPAERQFLRGRVRRSGEVPPAR